uniref:serine/threonine-protein kinase n=1 Tax=Nocardiopsis sp. CC223A TaxID=3044051 RepID=UPI00278C5DB0
MSLSLYVGPDAQPDKYRLVRSVGRGGEATLYLAEVTLAGQTEPVVVKALNADIAADSAQFAELSTRWAEQAELLRFINRLGVVGVREHFEGAPEHPRDGAGEQTDRCLYLVMNHIDGLDLRDWRAEHAREGARGQREVLRYLEQIAQVLDMLHAGRATPSKRPVVHGDLSPGNIMIDADGQATLVDFGLSRIAARHMTARPWFTPGYAAPEIFSGEYSPATDRYAFGAVAFYALTGEDPPTAPEQLRERFAALPLLADAEERTRALVAAMFSAEPADRPEASAWVGALRTLATSVPWTGPGSDPAGDPGTSAVFAASLFSAALPEPAAPAQDEDTSSTAVLDPSVLPRGLAVAGPPPSGLPAAPRPSGAPADAPASAVSGASGGAPASSASGGTSASGGAQAPAAPAASSASGGTPAPGGAQAPDAFAVPADAPAPAVSGAPPGPSAPSASGGAQASDAFAVPADAPASAVSGAPPGPSAPSASGGTPGPSAPSASGGPPAPPASSASGGAQAPAGEQSPTASGDTAGDAQSTDATVVLPPSPGTAAPAPGTPPGTRTSVARPGAPRVPGGPAGAPAPSDPSGPPASSAASAPGVPQGAATSGGAQGPGAARGPGGSAASGWQGTGATAAPSPTPAFGTPAASSDTESTIVLPENEPRA